ncbi:GyrI-like domain-containing protein [Sediminicola luteus]|uniref:AraC effector-binding domain-containing protein n=1 Tax=Sediminicola luteus TaxID=319238 RepID=A0A2A4GAI1_9FLAO|nr:GyrI-like domain-containing protein [Sediminicola luteus]PCE65959.1 hypothetical protein B7P33_01260 [Sediminicola luteus]
MGKKLKWGLVLLIPIGLLYYLFWHPFDYQVGFTTQTTTGTLNQTIKLWNQTQKNGKIIAQKGLNELTQEIQVGDSIHRYHWQIQRKTDTTLYVRVRVTDTENSISNRLALPFGKTDFKTGVIQKVTDFNTALNEHLDKIDVRVNGPAEIESMFCAYIPLEGKQLSKAREMMQYYPLLSNFVIENGLETSGIPFVEVSHWDPLTEDIKYNFCYPISPTVALPQHPTIKYKRIHAKKALKATYHGNYITSDRAWYALLEYAEKQGLEIAKQPIEYFFNNPNIDIDEKKWKAEIFMPLK